MMPVDGGIIQHGIQLERQRAVYMLAHHGFFRIPFMGRTLNRIGSVVAHPDNAHRLLAEDDRLVLVFPEGAKGPVKPASERYQACSASVAAASSRPRCGPASRSSPSS